MNNERGFTLIEVLIYLGLFAIIMVGVIATTYNIFESNGRIQTKAMVQEEGDFLMAKINYALTGATLVSQPLSGNSGNTLTLTKSGIIFSFSYDVTNPNNKKLQLQRGAGLVVALNNSNVSVETGGSIFSHTGSGSNPESVTASFTLNAYTPNGQSFSQDFQTTKYLRK